MKILDQAPPVIPPWNPGSAFWRFWNNEFTHPIADYPTGRLLGKTSLEYNVSIATLKDEFGHELTAEDEEGLRLAHDYPHHDGYDEWDRTA